MTELPPAPGAPGAPGTPGAPDGTGARGRPSRGAVLRAVVLAAGLVGIALAVRAGADELEGNAMPSPAALAGVAALTLVASLAAARAWSALLPGVDRAVAHEAIYVSQLAKYLPVGGIAQAAAQLGLTASAGLPAATVGAAWVVAMVAAVAASSLVGLAVVVVPGVPLLLRVAALVASASCLFLHPAALRRTFGVVGRRIPRLGVDGSHVPAAGEIGRCLAWSVTGQLAFAGAMAVAVRSLDGGVPAWQVVAGAAFAWLCGFVVVVLPGGVGVREAVFAAVVPAPTAALLAASLAARLALLAGECALVAGSSLRRRLARGRTPEIAPGSGATRTLAGDERRDG